MAELPAIHSSSVEPTTSKQTIRTSLDVPEKLKELTIRDSLKTPPRTLIQTALAKEEYPSTNNTVNERKLQKVFTEGVKDIDQAQSLFLGAPLLAFVQGKTETP